MIRAAGMLGMGAMFLMISPKLRLTVYAGLEAGVNGMETYSPYSYVAAGVCLLIAGLTWLVRGSRAR